MAHWLSSFGTFVEDLGLVPKTHIVINKHHWLQFSSIKSTLSNPRENVNTCCTDIFTDKTPIDIILKQ